MSVATFTLTMNFQKASPKYLLLLGEGNFSFGAGLSKALVEHSDYLEQYGDISSDFAGLVVSDETVINCHPLRIIATDLNQDFLSKTLMNKENFRDKQVQKNIATVNECGGVVFLDLDATNLESHQGLLNHRENIQKIIFNFPHVKSKKMQIGLNRKLLRNFFISARNFVNNENSEIEVCVTLCAGQSGINEIEKKKRKRDDSWQIVEMSACGSFILKKIEPFDEFWTKLSASREKSDLSKIYESCGYRNGHTSFRWEDANTFTFVQRSPPLLIPNFITEENTIARKCFLDDNVAFQLDKITKSLSILKCSNPVIVFLKNVFSADATHIKARLNFEEVDSISQFGFWSAINLWVKRIKEKQIRPRLQSILGNSQFLRALDLKDNKDDGKSVALVINEVTIGFVRFPMHEDLEEWDINFTTLLSLFKDADWRLIYSEYCSFIDGGSTCTDFIQGKITTHSLYPQEYSYDTSFWTFHHKCTNPVQIEFHPLTTFRKVYKVAFCVYGPLLKSIEQKDEYFPPGEPLLDQQSNNNNKCPHCSQGPQKVSLLYTVKIQSLDRPLSKELANLFDNKFREGLSTLLRVELR